MNVFDYFFNETKHLENDFVIGNKETISYKDLYINSLKVASYINENIGEDKNIVLIGQNSVFFITVYLGILKSGNVCVPLDFSVEKDNFIFINKLTESKIIFYDEKIKTKLDLKDYVTKIDEEQIIENQTVK